MKQRVVYQTAVENVLVPLGGTLALSEAQISRSDTVDYCGNKIYDNGKLRQIFNTEGYWTPEQGGEYFYYLKDHLGSNRVVLNASGEIAQVNHYYAFGMAYGEGKGSELQNYKYNGKELDRMHGLDWQDYGARHYDNALGRWHSIDPLAEKYYSISPYVYCANNPVIFVDPDGRRPFDYLEVEKNKDDTYTIVNGKADSDKKVYVVDKAGNRTGEVLGEMLTEYSFHDDNGDAVRGANISLNEQSGQDFFNDEIEDVGLFKYMPNATGGKLYDFKRRGLSKDEKSEIIKTQHVYRGMLFQGTIASARDVGNYAAGYVAGVHGFSWKQSRFAFDALETKDRVGWLNTIKHYPSNRIREGQPTQRAERAGHTFGVSIFIQRQLKRR